MAEIGIDHITKITNIVVDIANQGVQSFQDGFQAMDLLSFIDEGAALGAASKSWKELPAEIKNLKQDEINTITKNVETRLNIPNQTAKVIVTKAFTLIISGSDLYFAIKSARDARKGV